MKVYKCDACFNLFTVSFTWKINLATSCILKVLFMRLVGALYDRTIDMFPQEAETAAKIFSRILPELFTKFGKDLRIKCMKIAYC